MTWASGRHSAVDGARPSHYAVNHRRRVRELVLWRVTTTTRPGVDWLTWTMGEVYPEALADLQRLVPDIQRGGNPLPPTSGYWPSRSGRQGGCSAGVVRLGGASRDDRLRAEVERTFRGSTVRLGFARLVTHYCAITDSSPREDDDNA